MVTRRDFLTTTALGAGVAVGLPVHQFSSPPVHQFKLGVASYSLRKFQRDKAIAMVKALGTPYINLKDVHLATTLSPAELAEARREIEAAGLTIVGGGTITFETDTDDGVRK